MTIIARPPDVTLYEAAMDEGHANCYSAADIISDVVVAFWQK